MIDQILAARDGLSVAERRIADWVIQNPRLAAESTLARVAAACGVSEATVVRFSRSLGLKGFRAFTLRLAGSLGQAGYLHRDVAPADSATSVAEKVFDASLRELVNTREGLADQPFAGIAELLAGARQIIFVGVGGSGQVAMDARHKFFRLGIPCVVLNQYPDILQQCAIAEPDDVFFFISTRGHWRELVDAARTASSRGSACVALTRSDAALADAVDWQLCCEPEEDTSVFTPMTSRLSQLALLDALFVVLAMTLGDEAEERLRISKSVLVPL